MQKLDGGSGRRWGLGSRRVTAGAHIECLVRRASGAAMYEPLALAEVLHPESPIGGGAPRRGQAVARVRTASRVASSASGVSGMVRRRSSVRPGKSTTRQSGAGSTGALLATMRMSALDVKKISYDGKF